MSAFDHGTKRRIHPLHMTGSEPQALQADRPRYTRETDRDVPSGSRVA
jgi:hypothetical protein